MVSRGGLREDRAQALVEMALVLPIFLLLVLGIVEFAKAYNYWDQTNQVANATARWVVVDQIPAYTDLNGNPVAENDNPNLAAYKAYVESQLVGKDLRTSTPTANVKICFPNGTLAGSPVTVALATQYNPIGFLTSALSLTKINFKGSATMRLEQTPNSNITSGDTGC